MFSKGELCVFRNDTYHDSKHGLFGTVQAAESSLIVPEHFLEHLPTPTACISSKEVSA